MIYGHTEREVSSGRKFFEQNGDTIGQEIVRREMQGPRRVCQNASFVACVAVVRALRL